MVLAAPLPGIRSTPGSTRNWARTSHLGDIIVSLGRRAMTLRAGSPWGTCLWDRGVDLLGRWLRGDLAPGGSRHGGGRCRPRRVVHSQIGACPQFPTPLRYNTVSPARLSPPAIWYHLDTSHASEMLTEHGTRLQVMTIRVPAFSLTTTRVFHIPTSLLDLPDLGRVSERAIVWFSDQALNRYCGDKCPTRRDAP